MLEIIIPVVAIIGLVIEVAYRLKDTAAIKRQQSLQSAEIEALLEAVKEFKAARTTYEKTMKKIAKSDPKVQLAKLEQEKERTRRKEMEESGKTTREGMRLLKRFMK